MRFDYSELHRRTGTPEELIFALSPRRRPALPKTNYRCFGSFATELIKANGFVCPLYTQ
jgi:hypothetical protein